MLRLYAVWSLFSYDFLFNKTPSRSRSLIQIIASKTIQLIIKKVRKIEQSVSFVAFSSLEFIDTVYIVSKITSCVITKSLITLFKVSVIFQILIRFTIFIIVTSTFARILSMIFLACAMLYWIFTLILKFVVIPRLICITFSNIKFTSKFALMFFNVY